MNAETVRDTTIANSEADHWNGARQPFGYQTRAVKTRVLAPQRMKSSLRAMLDRQDSYQRPQQHPAERGGRQA